MPSLRTTRNRSPDEELHRSEALKGAILAASLDCIITIDHMGRIVEFNPAAEAAFGRSREQALGRDMADLLVPPRLRAAHRKGFARFLATRAPVAMGHRLELEACRADGTEFPIELVITALEGTDVPMFTGFIRDIGARRATERKLKRLHRVEAVLSGINALIVGKPARGPLLEQACRIAVGQGELRMAYIGLVDMAAGFIRPVAWAGDVGDFFTSAPREVAESEPRGWGIAGRAVWEGRPMVSNDLHGDPAILMKAALAGRGIQSLAVIPLVVEGTAIGVFALYSSEANFFDAGEMPMLLEMAGNVSLALEHMDKARKLERLTRVNALLSRINGAIVRIRNREELFQEACRIAVETGGLAFVWIGVADAETRQCVPVASAGMEPALLELFRDRMSLDDNAPGGHGLGARAIRGRRALVVQDVEADGNIKYFAELGARGVKSMAALPIMIDGKAVGAIALYASEGLFFDDEEMSLLGEVSANIAFAVDHIDRQESLRRLTRVYAFMSGINSLIVRADDRGRMFREACRIAVEDGGFRLAWIAIIDPVAGALVPVATGGDVRGFFTSNYLAKEHNSAGGPGMPGRAAREMKPMIANDVRTDPAILRKAEMEERGIRSAAHIPLIVGGASIGVLALYSGEAGFFDDEEVRLLVRLAVDLAHAIDHIDKNERLDYLAYYDALTGLPNRTLFLGRVSQGMHKAAAAGGKLALVLIDLERFKSINDTLGRAAGDQLLMEVAAWLRRHVGDAELLGHIGADRFAVLIPSLGGESSATRLLGRATRVFLKHPFQLAGTTYRVAAKVGVAMFPRDGIGTDALFKHAEAALKKAKSSGERVLFYRPTMTALVAGKLTLENQLRDAISRGEFVLHYQPKVHLASRRLTGAEALIRWNDPRTGLVAPGRFIPVLEETGLIEEVGRWALGEALREYLRWRSAGLPAVRIAVNVSPLQLRSPGFITTIHQAIAVGDGAAAGLELEITESLIMEDVEHSIATLRAVREMGVCVAIDDFGTGFSSLSYLSKLPVDAVKIDRSFVGDMAAGPEGLALVSTIINLAHSLRLKVVAEGVETAEQSRLLRLLDCDEMQGFLLSKAVAGADFEARFLAPPAGP